MEDNNKEQLVAYINKQVAQKAIETIMEFHEIAEEMDIKVILNLMQYHILTSSEELKIELRQEMAYVVKLIEDLVDRFSELTILAQQPKITIDNKQKN